MTHQRKQTMEVMNNNKGRKYKQQGHQQKPQTHSEGQQAKNNEF